MGPRAWMREEILKKYDLVSNEEREERNQKFLQLITIRTSERLNSNVLTES